MGVWVGVCVKCVCEVWGVGVCGCVWGVCVGYVSGRTGRTNCWLSHPQPPSCL